MARFDFVRGILGGPFTSSVTFESLAGQSLHLGGWRSPFAPSILGRTHPTGIGLPQLSDQQLAKVDPPFLPTHGFETYRISNEGFAHKALASLPPDLAIAPHPTHGPLSGIAQDRASLRLGMGPIDLCRRPLPQRLVRTNGVVAFYPSIGAPLLCTRVARTGPSDFRRHYSMHLLVPTILFGMAWSDEFHPNSQGDPPGAQARKPRRPAGCKRTAVVGPNDQRVAIFSEQPQKNPPHRFPALIRQQPDGQDIAAQQISHRQRLDPTTILSAKPSFEIHRPDVVASTSLGQGSNTHQRSSASTPTNPATELHSLEPSADGARARTTLIGVVLDQPGLQLATSPTAMASAQTPDASQPLRPRSLRRAVRTARPIVEAPWAFLLEAFLPFVAVLPTQPEQPTQLRHALLALQSQLHKLQPSPNPRHCLPCHGPEKAGK